METQHYKNHARTHPIYHYVLSLLVVGGLIASIVYLVKTEDAFLGVILVVMSLSMAVTFALLRIYPLKAQDRAIRAEENLRHYVLTGRLLDSKLTPGQIVALRFAPDNEFPGLAEKAAAENMNPKEIKQAINNWKADHHRI
ncbi:DUF6526 family protein [Fictibacillus phosphorivorans]|uniref:DUF6526 family protein n=1 Tax=Fictibacillus phosphorivorans TaxID=1221500 RepID=UPI002041802A|nr:DUF6526 family protein [Fictibacillus phosphorivorans]MCM3719919.1 DUF6526 family protein [Fictibacillus phosphorivorans]MCM3777627.1 DUF6526 family protein [Fictibacillus phosphorivorans]